MFIPHLDIQYCVNTRDRMSCSKCNKEVQENWKRCPLCMTKIRRCQICSKIIDASWRCCPFCDDSSEELEGAIAADLDLGLGSDAHPDICAEDKPVCLTEAERRDVTSADKEIDIDVCDENVKSYLNGIHIPHNADASKIKTLIADDLNNWNCMRINIGIVGESGTGKSSLINAFRGLDSSDSKAAPVGILETTMEITEYKDPRNPNIVYWDVPGVGTDTVKKKHYLAKIEFDRYDFFIIVSATRFKYHDTWLANKINERKKKFYFVRAKIDADIENELSKIPKRTKNDIIKSVKGMCINELHKSNIENPQVFLINNKNTQEYDFKEMLKSILDDLPTLQKEAMLVYMPILSTEDLEEKMLFLKNRIFKVAIKSAVGAAIPVPGLGFALDLAVLVEEMSLYKKTFATDDHSLNILARAFDVKVDDLKMKLNIVAINSAAHMATFSAGLGLAHAKTNAINLALPFLGSLVSSPLAYGASVCIQRKLLALCYGEGQRVLNLRLEILEKERLRRKKEC